MTEKVKIFQVGLGTFGTSSLAHWRQLGLQSQGEKVEVVGVASTTQKDYERLSVLFGRASLVREQIPQEWYDRIPFHSGDNENIAKAIRDSNANAVFVCTPDWAHHA